MNKLGIKLHPKHYSNLNLSCNLFLINFNHREENVFFILNRGQTEYATCHVGH